MFLVIHLAQKSITCEGFFVFGLLDFFEQDGEPDRSKESSLDAQTCNTKRRWREEEFDERRADDDATSDQHRFDSFDHCVSGTMFPDALGEITSATGVLSKTWDGHRDEAVQIATNPDICAQTKVCVVVHLCKGTC